MLQHVGCDESLQETMKLLHHCHEKYHREPSLISLAIAADADETSPMCGEANSHDKLCVVSDVDHCAYIHSCSYGYA